MDAKEMEQLLREVRTVLLLTRTYTMLIFCDEIYLIMFYVRTYVTCRVIQLVSPSLLDGIYVALLSYYSAGLLLLL